MRHQPARVILAACLATASAAAQAPLSFRNFEANDLGGTSPGENGANPRETNPSENGRLLDSPGPAPWAASRSSSGLSLGAESTAQDPDYTMRGMFRQAHGTFLNGMSRYEPMAKFNFEVLPNQRIKGEPGVWNALGGAFDADLPFVLSTEGYLLLGGYYKTRHYQFSSATTLSDDTLHAAGIKLGFGAFVDENILLEVETHPGAFTDADATLHHEDFDFPSHALMTFRATEHIFWKAGARYNQTFKDAPWLPYLGVSWDITGTATPEGEANEGGMWRIDVLLPEYLELSYWPTPGTGLLWGADVSGAEYHVRTSMGTGNQRDNLRIQEVTSYLGFVQRFSDVVSLSVRAGVVIAGDYELTNGFSGFNKVDGALDQGFFARAEFGIDW